jgi:hypothetical protein
MEVKKVEGRRKKTIHFAAQNNGEMQRGKMRAHELSS